MDRKINIEVSARHVHLSRRDIDIMFGSGYELTYVRDLSQPGQFATKERVEIVGPKSSIKNVIVLGPERDMTQVEMSITDTVALGLSAPIRESGDLVDATDVLIRGPLGEVTGKMIVAKRHIHMTSKDAQMLGLINGQIIAVRVDTSRKLIFDEVIARVSENYRLFMHIDTDEANAAAIGRNGCIGEIL